MSQAINKSVNEMSIDELQAEVDRLDDLLIDMCDVPHPEEQHYPHYTRIRKRHDVLVMIIKDREGIDLSEQYEELL